MREAFRYAIGVTHSDLYPQKPISDLDSLISAIRNVAPKGADGLRSLNRPWPFRQSWDLLLRQESPHALAHILQSKLLQKLTLDQAVTAALCPPMYMRNEGFSYWYRPVTLLAGYRTLGVLHV